MPCLLQVVEVAANRWPGLNGKAGTDWIAAELFFQLNGCSITLGRQLFLDVRQPVLPVGSRLLFSGSLPAVPDTGAFRGMRVPAPPIYNVQWSLESWDYEGNVMRAVRRPVVEKEGGETVSYDVPVLWRRKSGGVFSAHSAGRIPLAHELHAPSGIRMPDGGPAGKTRMGAARIPLTEAGAGCVQCDWSDTRLASGLPSRKSRMLCRVTSAMLCRASFVKKPWWEVRMTLLKESRRARVSSMIRSDLSS